MWSKTQMWCKCFLSPPTPPFLILHVFEVILHLFVVILSLFLLVFSLLVVVLRFHLHFHSLWQWYIYLQ